jgi:hypothetical protein
MSGAAAPDRKVPSTDGAAERSDAQSGQRRGAEANFAISGLDGAKNRENEANISRSETFRIAGRKLLKSLAVPNQAFRGIVGFQALNTDFVSPFSNPCVFQP